MQDYTTLMVLAGVAVFLLFKLKSVLGTKTGHEQPPASARRDLDEGAEVTPIQHPAEPVDEGPFADAFADMRRVEPDFSPTVFVSGARQAYEMLLMAFENGDKDTLQKFLSPDVFQGFAAVIDARADEGLTVDARFVGLRKTEIVGARFDPEDNVAEIDMSFIGELITVVRDSEHRVVEGDPNEVRREHDRWTFGRQLGARDPNWLLIATGE
ncbi:MAG: Tim44/TimA family putative adaptor protein [Pikeienuella sp.]